MGIWKLQRKFETTRRRSWIENEQPCCIRKRRTPRNVYEYRLLNEMLTNSKMWFLYLAAHPASAFDIAISNILEPYSVEHSFDLLSEVVRVLKPSGSIYAKEKDSNIIDTKVTALKLAGFINPVYKKGDTYYEITAKKSDFEIGSSSKLSFGKPAVWSLANSLVDDDVEFINENDLLDESDLLKPDAESLRGIMCLINYVIFCNLRNWYFIFSILPSVWHNWKTKGL